MPDSVYKEHVLLFQSKGIFARQVDDLVDPQGLLNEDNVEELAEGAYAQRLGSTIVNAQGTIGQPVYPLSGSVKTVFKLGQLAGVYARYAVTSDGALWRRSSLTVGAYSKISTGFSGSPCSAASWTNTDWTSSNYAFFADALGMFKDNGAFGAPQQMGIFPPQYPVLAQSQEPPVLVDLDDYVTSAGSYTASNTSPSNIAYVATTLTSAVAATGIQAVTVADPTQPGLFQLLTIGYGRESRNRSCSLGDTDTGL